MTKAKSVEHVEKLMKNSGTEKKREITVIRSEHWESLNGVIRVLDVHGIAGREELR